MSRPVPVPTELEREANLLLGPDLPVEPLPDPAPGGVRAALDEVLAAALAQPPCVVSFSGGRDSSAVLALALDTARRHGLEPPVPVTMRFPRAPATDETRWQELVLRHLRAGPAEILSLTDELDALGPAATTFLRRHGLRWPGNIHMHAPVVALARGGTLLTGAGGDELLGSSSPPRSLRSTAAATLPLAVRAQLRRRRHPAPPYPWLQPRADAEVRLALARDEASWPYPWDEAVHHWYRSRAFAALDGVLRLLAHDAGANVVNPLLAPAVLAALAVTGGRSGFRTRAQGMHRLVGDLLPVELLQRETKAIMGGALWGPRMRGFVAAWDGTGVDPERVDVAALRATLSRPDPDFRTILLLQQAWLAQADVNPATS